MAVAALLKGLPAVPAGDIDGSICKPFCQKANAMIVVIMFGIVGAVVATVVMVTLMLWDVTVGECLSADRESQPMNSSETTFTILARQIWRRLPTCVIDVALIVSAVAFAAS